MSHKELTDAAIKHLYAGELLRKIALDLSTLMEHMTDEQLEVGVRLRQVLIGYAQSELTVTQGLCEIAEQEQSKC